MTPEPIAFTGSANNVLRGDYWPSGSPNSTPNLFMHGGGQTRHAWDAAAARVTRIGPAITVDARGHGESDWVGDGDYRMPSIASDLVEISMQVREGFGRPPVLVGASMGGICAMVAGEAHPDLFAALVLVDITPRMEQSGVDRVLGFMGERARDGFASVDEAADAIAAYLPQRKRPRSLDGLAKNLRQRDDGRWYWHWDPAFVSGPMAVESRLEQHAERLTRGVQNLRCPILLVRGSQSELVSEEAVADFRAAVPHAEFVDVSGAGHMVAGDRNDVFADAVIDFIERTEAAA